MWVDKKRLRVLLIAKGLARDDLRAVFARPNLAGWRLDEADTFERARFAMHMQDCDVVLLDGGFWQPAPGEELRWLIEQATVPVVLLADEAGQIEAGLGQGLSFWLPRSMSLANPGLLELSLRRLTRLGEGMARSETNLQDCQDRLHQLTGLLWEAAPGEGPGRWHTQRHMLYRLEEEVDRARRHGGPLAVVLGEVHPAERLHRDEAPNLATWTADRVGKGKRRCDVAGRYGLQGFMLVLPQASSNQAVGCCQRLRGLLEQGPEGTPALPPLYAYFGVVNMTPETGTVNRLLSRAEERLDRARTMTGGVVCD